MPVAKAASDLSHEPVAEQIEKQVILKMCDAYGLRIEPWSGTLNLESVKDASGQIVKNLSVPVSIKFTEQNADDKGPKARAKFSSDKLEITIAVMTKYISVDKSGTMRLLRKKSAFEQYCSSIVHELTHQIDRLIHSNEEHSRMKAPKREKGEEHNAEYYKSTSEFRAFLRQVIYRFEKQLTRWYEENLKTEFDKNELLEMPTGKFVETLFKQEKLGDKYKRLYESNKNGPHYAELLEQMAKLQQSLRRRYSHMTYSGA